MADYLTPDGLAALLGSSGRTLRRAVADAEEHARAGTASDADRALLTVDRTPRGGHLRWSRANAARVLRAFGKPVPAEWTASPAGPEASR